MSSVYADDVAGAAADLAAAGAPVTITRDTSDYNAATDSTVPSSTTSATSAVQRKSDWRKVQALGLTLSKTVTLLVAASGMAFDPQMGDTLTWNGVTYAVKDVQTLAPDGTAIVHTVIGSRG